MKKILISDYDGTFYQNDIDIKENIDKVTEFRTLGNIFVMATGRSYVDLKIEIDKYKIPYDYLILNHGALLLSKELNVISSFNLDKDQVDSILDYVNNNKDIYDIVLIDNFKKRVTDKSSVVKIMLKISSFDKAREVKSFIDKNYTNIKSYLVRDGDHYLVEIISNKASKSLMIEKIVETENIKNKDVYTIGDGINDVDMVRDYNGYRVKNSCDELNTITNKVVDSVNDLIKEII